MSEDLSAREESTAPSSEDAPPRRPRYALHGLLLLATCVTVAKAGADLGGPTSTSWFAPGQLVERLPQAWPFVLALMGILMAHEMGHYLVARLHGVDASLPFFVPLPFGLVGTLGAVIGMPTARDRNKLVDIGAAGPLAGMVVAVPVLLYGLSLSSVGPQASGLLEGNSLLYIALKLVVTGKVLPGGGLDVQLHAVAFAGWVGLLVTMINLIPVGQLDGGHIAYAYFGAGQNRASLWLHRVLVPLGLLAYSYTVVEQGLRGIAWGRAAVTSINVGATWIVWWGMLHLLRRMSGGEYHPPVDDTPLTAGRRRLCVGMLVLFALLFMPIPLRVYLAPQSLAKAVANH
ncbi:MAG: site-2 protease family protein [Deltaproteobacteria bacterium]|nr:MAG: site-2 protease family protein [Pseudomonadota bacterium]PIE65989.1 MAG: site-2 protease family protein [Deltaproteobacteria bacterium]